MTLYKVSGSGRITIVKCLVPLKKKTCVGCPECDKIKEVLEEKGLSNPSVVRPGMWVTIQIYNGKCVAVIEENRKPYLEALKKKREKKRKQQAEFETAVKARMKKSYG